MISTNERSQAPELMDDFNMEGEILRDALDKIAAINRLLGGNKVTLEGIKKLIGRRQTISILDVGCGGGDMLRMLAAYAKEKRLDFQLKGIDANAFTIKHARAQSADYENISYECQDIFEHISSNHTYDIIICTLTIHHFHDGEIIELLEHFTARAKIGVVINDLHRSPLAYYLFKALCAVFRLNYMSEQDGLVSILRGFKQKDLRRYAQTLNLKKHRIRWKWAFRYQWIIYSESHSDTSTKSKTA
ncbi:SAM-dependent methyltransferase [Pedobacter sp. BAL39]|uniref:methyltransferase domain-containing protein n=1 Tax=Pedobacter sp. BAL39 TaxID=391596 RepID=UPI00015591EC|nr:methyltransferase domain-containing protein [Pedobacter sp. BAL39]EDM36627.1 SAM-dependent methyltransferase [Pedobacter sp. BAL39]